MAQNNFKIFRKSLTQKHPALIQFIWIGIGLVLAIASAFATSSFVGCWKLTAVPGIPLPACSGTTGSTNIVPANVAQPTGDVSIIDLSVPQAELPPPWDGASQLNILVMGYDYGDWSADRNCPCRTDTMIVVTIDPLSHSAGMLSIPRDMWVRIPGFDAYNKINTANFLGDLYKLPGGGVELARKTVEEFLGIPIQYYAMIDFTTFEKMIDTIGGVDVDIPAEIIVDPLGPHNTTTLQPGVQHLTGPLALAYARMRYTANDDMDRAARQQQVVFAIRDKLLSPANFLNLITQAPALYAELSGGFTTNLSLSDALRLAVFVMGIPLDQIRKGVLDYSTCSPGEVTVDGQVLAILKPYPDKIREIVNQVLGNALVPMTAGDATQKMQQEAARVLIVNGSGVDGIASRTAELLKAQGMNVIGYGNLDDYPDQYSWPPLSARSMLILHTGKPYALEYLQSLLNMDRSDQFLIEFDPNAPADVVLALGADWAYTNPMP